MPTCYLATSGPFLFLVPSLTSTANSHRSQVAYLANFSSPTQDHRTSRSHRRRAGSSYRPSPSFWCRTESACHTLPTTGLLGGGRRGAAPAPTRATVPSASWSRTRPCGGGGSNMSLGRCRWQRSSSRRYATSSRRPKHRVVIIPKRKQVC